MTYSVKSRRDISSQASFEYSKNNWINNNHSQANSLPTQAANTYKSWSWGSVPDDRTLELLYAIKVARFNQKLQEQKVEKQVLSEPSNDEQYETLDKDLPVNTTMEGVSFANPFKYAKFKSIMRKILGKSIKNFSKYQLLLLPSIIMRMQKLTPLKISATINNISKMQVRGDVGLNPIEISLLAFISYGDMFNIEHLALIQELALNRDTASIDDAAKLSRELIAKDSALKNSSVFQSAISFMQKQALANENFSDIPLTSNYLRAESFKKASKHEMIFAEDVASYSASR